jgi:hypothetical protein
LGPRKLRKKSAPEALADGVKRINNINANNINILAAIIEIPTLIYQLRVFFILLNLSPTFLICSDPIKDTVIWIKSIN